MAVTHRLPVKALSMGAAALVLGGTFATAPAITASPDSPFGLVQAANAATAPLTNVQTTWTVPDNLRGLGTESGTFTVTGGIADSVKPGDTITFEVPSGMRIGGVQNLPTPSGEIIGTLAENTGTKVSYTVTDFVNGKTGITFQYEGAYTFNNGGKVTGDTVDIKVNINGTEYASGSTYTFDIPNVTQFSPSLYAGQTTVDNAINAAFFAGPRDIPGAAEGGYTLTSNLPDDKDITFSAKRLPSLKWGDTYSHSFYINNMGLVKWVPNGENSWILESTNGQTSFERDGVVIDLPVGSTYNISADGKQSVLHLIDPNNSPDSVESLTGALYTELGNTAMAEGYATGVPQVYPISGEAAWGDIVLTSEQSRPAGSFVTYNFTKGGGTGEFATPTASIKAFAFDATGSGTTADGQNSDANDAPVYTLSNTGTIFLSAPNKDAFAVDQRIVQVDEAGNIIGEVASFTGVAPGTTSTFTISAVDLPMGASTFYYKVLTTNPLNPDLKAEASDPVKIERQAIPTAQVDVVTYINGEDANTPVVLAPGSYEVTGTVANPNSYALTSANTTVEWVAVVDGKEQAPVAVALPADFTIPAGAEGALPTTKVDLPKQGEVGGFYRVKVAQAYTLAAVLGGNGVATANAQDPAYATALTGTITTAPDETRVRVGEAFSIPLLDNDTTDPEGHPLDPATIKLSETDGWVKNEDGSFTNAEWGITGSVVNGNFEGTAGSVEGAVIAPNYTVENTLGDISELTGITIKVYDFHVGLEALIGEEQQDADGKDDAYTITITDEAVDTVTEPITLPVTNTGNEPITVTGFQQVNTSDGGDGFEITLDEPVTLAPGESFTYTYDIELPVGEHVIDYKVLTVEGAVDTDPVYVDVVKEIVPNEAPSHAVPELTIEPTPEANPETPVVEQEKPKAPTPVVPETGGKGATVEAKTADELAGSDAAVVASAPAAPAGFSAGKVVAGVLGSLAALALAAWGAVTLRNRKAKDA